MRLALPIEAVDRTVDGAVEIVGVDESAIGEVMAFEVAPGMFDLVRLGVSLGSHSTVSHGRSASALVVSLLVWIGPLSWDCPGLVDTLKLSRRGVCSWPRPILPIRRSSGAR